MMLRSLHLKNFRSYKDATFEFSPGINAILGENAQGKTNLLEAIYFLITGKSFRTNHLHDLIHFGASFFYLEAHFLKNEVEHCLKIYCDGKERKILYNATPLNKVSDLLGILKGAVLTPEDYLLITGPPNLRRRFLDLHIAQTKPSYIEHLSRYNKALKYRNHLLRNHLNENIEIWEQQLAHEGALIACERKAATGELDTHSHHFQSQLSNALDDLKISYKTPSCSDIQAYYLEQFEKNREREKIDGYTRSGPHKDDLAIFLKDKEACTFASEGQKRTISASLRLSEWSRLKESADEPPIFCIDDLAVSLDLSRERHFFTLLSQLNQVFFTSPKLKSNFPTPVHTIEIICLSL